MFQDEVDNSSSFLIFVFLFINMLVWSSEQFCTVKLENFILVLYALRGKFYEDLSEFCFMFKKKKIYAMFLALCIEQGLKSSIFRLTIF